MSAIESAYSDLIAELDSIAPANRAADQDRQQTAFAQEARKPVLIPCCQGADILPEFQIWWQPEPAAAGIASKDDAHIKKLLDAYKKERAGTEPGVRIALMAVPVVDQHLDLPMQVLPTESGMESTEWSAEVYEKDTLPSGMTAAAWKFAKRLSRAPSQCLRHRQVHASFMGSDTDEVKYIHSNYAMTALEDRCCGLAQPHRSRCPARCAVGQGCLSCSC